MKKFFVSAIFIALTVTSFSQTFNYTGSIVTYVVPAGTTSIQVQAYGAEGGSTLPEVGGKGAYMSGTFGVTPGDTFYILVGQKGEDHSTQAGGGGGSFVVRRVVSSPYLMANGRYVEPLIVAGGGGGTHTSLSGTVDFIYGSSASSASNSYLAFNTPNTLLGGTAGNGGETWHAGGGGGFLTNGVQLPGSGNTVASYGSSFLNLGAGGVPNAVGAAGSGGYGGGGAGHSGINAGGGGGGYSGGAGGLRSHGGGGGSFNAGTNQINISNNRTGNGMVIITPQLSVTITQVSSITCNGGSNGSLMANPGFGTAPYSYAWAPSGGNSQTASGLSAGTYTVTVTDATSATASTTFSLTQPVPVTLSQLSQNNVSCFGDNTGSASVNAATSPNAISAIDNNRAASNWSEINSVAGAGYANGISFESWVMPNASWVSSDGMIFSVNTSTGSNRFMFGYNATQQRFVYFDDIGGNRFQTGTAARGQWHHVVITVSNTSLVNMYVDGVSVLTYQSGLTYALPANDLISIGQEFDGIGVTSQYFDGLIDEVRIWNTVLSPATAIGNMSVCPYVTTSHPYYNNLVANYRCDEGSGSLLNDASPNNRDGNRIVGSGWALASVINYGCMASSPGGISYDWNPGSPIGDGTLNVSGLTAGNWICIATDPIGCTASTTFTITEPSSPVSGTTVVTNVSCFGGSNGAINLTPNGGTGPYTFAWTTGPTTEDRTGLAQGTYTVVITDANACTGSVTATVTEPPSSVSGTTQVTHVSCNGGTNGTINLTPAGGVGPYTFVWNTSHTTEDRTGLTQGSYSVTITDANGCTAVVGSVINEPTPLAITTTESDISCNGGSNGTASVSVSGGTPGYTYAWSSGGTGSTETGLTAGSYTCIITDNNSCTSSVTSSLTEPTALVVTDAFTDITCFGANDGTADVIVTGGISPYTYAWSPNSSTTSSATGLGAGTFSCTITDDNGCTFTSTFQIDEPSPISPNQMQNNISCAGGGNGHLMVSPSGGTGAYTYSWTPVANNTNVLNGSPAGLYSCTITDANGCTATATFNLTEPSALSVSTMQTNVSCNGGTNGDAMVMVTGGVSPYAYAWSSGGTGATESNLSAGSYSCTITDANNCSVTSTFTLTEPASLAVTTTQTDILCNGNSTGDATVNVSGGSPTYDYSWSSGGTGSTETGLSAGTYTCIITDYAGCSVTATVAITEPAAITDGGVATNATGCTTNDGAVDLSPAGGTAPFTFLWSNAAITEDITGIDGGIYSVTITDANGCTTSAIFSITEPGAPTVMYSEPVDTACGGTQPNPAFTLSGESPAGGTWTGPGVSANMFDASTANVGFNLITYTFTDAGGCINSATDSIWVDLCLNVNPIVENTFALYPNPTTGILNIITNGNHTTIVVTDALGQQVASVVTYSTATQIDLSAQANGIYFVHVLQNGNQTTQRVMIAR